MIVNEVLSHTDPPQEDAIELYNRSSSAVNLDGWYLSDDSGIRAKYRITNTVIAAHGYVVFYEYQFNTNALFDTNNTPKYKACRSVKNRELNCFIPFIVVCK